MSEKRPAAELEPARSANNRSGSGAPIARGELGLRRPGTGALACASCARAERRPAPGGREGLRAA
jgi:hypothetical protein